MLQESKRNCKTAPHDANVHVLSDTKLFGEGIYLMYVDFSSAFNTIDHDKLLIITYDLGFPVDCLEQLHEVAKNLYQDAETIFLLPCGENGPVRKAWHFLRRQALTSAFPSSS